MGGSLPAGLLVLVGLRFVGLRFVGGLLVGFLRKRLVGGRLSIIVSVDVGLIGHVGGALISRLAFLGVGGFLSGVVVVIDELVGQLGLSILGVLHRLGLGFGGLFRGLGFDGLNCRLGALVELCDSLRVLDVGGHIGADLRLGFGLFVARLHLVARGFHGLFGGLIVGGFFGGGREGGRGLLVHRVGEDLAQVRGDLRRGARRGGLGVLFARGLGAVLGRRGDRGLCGHAIVEGSRLLSRGGQLGRCGGGRKELRGMAVEARANRVHVEEKAPRRRRSPALTRRGARRGQCHPRP